MLKCLQAQDSVELLIAKWQLVKRDFGERFLFKPLSFLRIPDPYSGGVVISIVIQVNLFDFFLRGFLWRRTRWLRRRLVPAQPLASQVGVIEVGLMGVFFEALGK